MRNSIAVMNAKGGVGKSTLVLAVAETLSAKFAKTVLVIDTDAQASVSLMLLSAASLNRLQLDRLTIVDLLVANVLDGVAADWTRFVVAGVSDVEEARTVYLIPSDMQLTLFEREVAKEGLLTRLRFSVAALLEHVRSAFDIVLIDCPPGLSVLTEAWLREADFHITPASPDQLSTYALEVLNHFKNLNPEMGFAQHLGVLISMKDERSAVHTDHESKLVQNTDNLCFASTIPRTHALQHAAQFGPLERSYDTKYPGESGNALSAVCRELLRRLDAAQAASTAVPAAPSATRTDQL